MRQAFLLTATMKNDILKMASTRTLKDIASELDIPYHIVMQVNQSLITAHVKDHRLYSNQMKSLGLDYVTSARERFERAPLFEENGIVYKIIPSDENEWIKNDV
jgi:hypothetical protein